MLAVSSPGACLRPLGSYYSPKQALCPEIILIHSLSPSFHNITPLLLLTSSQTFPTSPSIWDPSHLPDEAVSPQNLCYGQAVVSSLLIIRPSSLFITFIAFSPQNSLQGRWCTLHVKTQKQILPIRTILLSPRCYFCARTSHQPDCRHDFGCIEHICDTRGITCSI